ncbi:SRPBCC family protein [Rhodophyticola porphyridii]|uniref:SRPBCC family protein n=1 Tax=Rhodophyticola porphyridii TaxID=1852017 RepID=UPI001B01710C|nr:SRPBCC family protein [Roseicyclus sp.]MBO6624934.1 SRPBCC family protein [Roseicyclus sp.]MBO6921238.1 SRPBCC family protein [Roseicyclus sp.]
MTTPSNKARVTQPGDAEILVTRRFAAPRALVFRAYTEPALMQRWLLGPPGWTMPVCEMDLRVGGAYRWQWRNEADGAIFGFHGEFLEVVTHARLVETQIYDPGTMGGEMGPPSIITIDFAEDGPETVLTTRIAFASPEACRAALETGMTDGMEQSYRQLDRLIPGMS